MLLVGIETLRNIHARFDAGGQASFICEKGVSHELERRADGSVWTTGGQRLKPSANARGPQFVVVCDEEYGLVLREFDTGCETVTTTYGQTYTRRQGAVWCDGQRVLSMSHMLKLADANPATSVMIRTERGDFDARTESPPPFSCYGCGAAAARSRCARCMDAMYCSKACQRAHWPVHRGACCPLAVVCD